MAKVAELRWLQPQYGWMQEIHWEQTGYDIQHVMDTIARQARRA